MKSPLFNYSNLSKVFVSTTWLLIVLFHDGQAQDNNPSFRESFISDTITFALTGDAIITRALRPYKEPQYLGMIDLIRRADAAFTNLEMLFHDYEGYPATHSGGTWMRAQPELAEELTWAGFDMVSLANNHTMDFGSKGLKTTIQTVRKAGLVYSGAGMNLAEARAPGYLDTDGGRVAIISVASTFSDEDRAGPQRKDMKGRPGLSPIRYRTTYTAPAEAIAALKEAAEGAGLRVRNRNNGIRLLGENIEESSETGSRTTPHSGDLEDILRWVREASRQADWVFVTSHTHEGPNRETPADFLITVARAVVDAGADLFVGHGPHALRPVEIYKGKPIFYSLGDFLFQNETVEVLPADMYERYGIDQDSLPGYLQDRRIERSGSRSFVNIPAIWESVIAVPKFVKGELNEIILHPVTLGFGEPRTQRGRPRLAGYEKGREIIEDLAKRSGSYGTTITYDAESNTGVIAIK